MHDETAQMDIRRLLKTFGVQADTAIVEHLLNHPDVESLRLRIRLEDATEYTDRNVQPLSFVVEGTVHRGS
ncbi:hypothetical protein EG834_13470 [bacterium]|nr:hypothetical protein [bacterium]